jgi:hypothetical protein
MRKVIYWMHMSVDGFVDGPNGEFDWPGMGPELSLPIGYAIRRAAAPGGCG